MSERTTWGIIGAGNIGGEVMRQLEQPHVAERLAMHQLPEFVMRSSGITLPDSDVHVGESLDELDILPDVVFVATPSTDDGKVAHDYLVRILERGGIAVTAEKGALSNYFTDLRDSSLEFARLGINATVGGGTRMLEVAESYVHDVDNITQIHLAVNGTLSAIMSSVGPSTGSGMSLGQAVHQAVQLGYAEPGSVNPIDVIKAEAEGDVPKKAAILFNKLGLSKSVVNWQDLRFTLSDEQVAHAVEEAKVRRFIVSMYSPQYLDSTEKCPEDEIIGGFNLEHEGWRIVGGFRHIDRNPLFAPLAETSGPSNGIVIGLGPDETDGVYSLVGPGAGVRQTANTMIDDYLRRRRQQ